MTQAFLLLYAYLTMCELYDMWARTGDVDDKWRSVRSNYASDQWPPSPHLS